MPLKYRESDNRGIGDTVELGEPTSITRTVIHVVMDGVRHEMETLDSFAIKFGLLTNMPVTKVKHLMRKLPASLWSGTSRTKAQGLLSLVEEAGGHGRLVVEEITDKPESESPSVADKSSSCRKCGFPLKKVDQFCDFCQTPVAGDPGKIRRVPVVDGKSVVPPERLLFYLLVLFAAVIITIVIQS